MPRRRARVAITLISTGSEPKLESRRGEGRLSEAGWRREQQWALDMGLPGAESLTDKTIPTSHAESCRILPASIPF